MVRVGGGWDTLQNYLDKHDPCRCRRGKKSLHSSSIITSSWSIISSAKLAVMIHNLYWDQHYNLPEGELLLDCEWRWWLHPLKNSREIHCFEFLPLQSPVQSSHTFINYPPLQPIIGSHQYFMHLSSTRLSCRPQIHSWSLGCSHLFWLCFYDVFGDLYMGLQNQISKALWQVVIVKGLQEQDWTLLWNWHSDLWLFQSPLIMKPFIISCEFKLNF